MIETKPMIWYRFGTFYGKMAYRDGLFCMGKSVADSFLTGESSSQNVCKKGGKNAADKI